MFRVLNYLVGGVTGSAESQLLSDYEFQEPMANYKNPFGWELSFGKNRNDASKVLLFKSIAKTTTAENAYDMRVFDWNWWLNVSRLKRIKTFRHPAVLKFISGQETDKNVFFVWFSFSPLIASVDWSWCPSVDLVEVCQGWIESKRGWSDEGFLSLQDGRVSFCLFSEDYRHREKLVSWIMLGLYNVVNCLKFLNEDTKHVHGNLNENSIFVTEV